MKLIYSGVEILPQESYDIEGAYKQIELAGRTCYHSLDKIRPDSAGKFISMLIASGHLSPLEHGTVYLKIPIGDPVMLTLFNMTNAKLVCPSDTIVNPWVKVVNKGAYVYVSTNYRFIYERSLTKYLKYLCEPTEYHERRITTRFTLSEGIAREFNRHRINSVCQQSTRYVSFGSNKLGKEIAFIIPSWYKVDATHVFMSNGNFYNSNHDLINTNKKQYLFLLSLYKAEECYMGMLESGMPPQEARDVLPLATATQLVHTAFISDWKHFLCLRSPKYGATGVHPDAARLADSLYSKIARYIVP